MKRGFERHIGKVMKTMSVTEPIWEVCSPPPLRPTLVNGANLTGVQRTGKHVITSWEGRNASTYDIVISPRMTGSLVWTEGPLMQRPGLMAGTFISMDHPEPSPKCLVGFIFEDGVIEYHDSRKFGKVRLVNSWLELPSLRELGRDLLNDDCDLGYVLSKVNQFLKHSLRTNIKTFLLDQKQIAGIGNYMASEILYSAQVRPDRLLSEVSVLDWQRILSYAKNLASLMISVGGVTLRDYNTFDGKPGDGKKFLQIYDKEKCPLGHPVSRVKLANRTTYSCSECQE